MLATCFPLSKAPECIVHPMIYVHVQDCRTSELFGTHCWNGKSTRCMVRRFACSTGYRWPLELCEYSVFTRNLYVTSVSRSALPPALRGKKTNNNNKKNLLTSCRRGNVCFETSSERTPPLRSMFMHKLLHFATEPGRTPTREPLG